MMSENNGHNHGNGKRPSVAFDDKIPTKGPTLFIKRMQGAEKRTFTVWGSRVRGIWVHWNSATNGSEPHYEENCSACSKAIPKRWKGFLHAYCQEDRQEVFLELTPTGASALMSQLDDPSNLRGSLIRVSRSVAKNGRLTIQYTGSIPDKNALPKEKDPRRSILKLWGVADAVANDWLGSSEEEIELQDGE